jgi:hypothetical protein
MPSKNGWYSSSWEKAWLIGWLWWFFHQSDQFVTDFCTVITEYCTVVTENCTEITKNCTEITKNWTDIAVLHVLHILLHVLHIIALYVHMALTNHLSFIAPRSCPIFYVIIHSRALNQSVIVERVIGPIGQLRIVALFMVFQRYSDILSISKIGETRWQNKL